MTNLAKTSQKWAKTSIWPFEVAKNQVVLYLLVNLEINLTEWIMSTHVTGPKYVRNKTLFVVVADDMSNASRISYFH